MIFGARKMKKLVFYIDSLYYGGAQRVMANLVTYFSKKYDVILINDFKMDQSIAIYEIPAQIKRLYLRDNLEGNPIIKNLLRVITLRKIIKKENPDAVLSFLGRPNERMLIATVGLCTRKVVSVRNTPEHEYGSSKIKRHIIKRLFLLADGVVFQTEEAAKYFQPSILRKSTVIINPVGTSFFETKRKRETHNIITVGRFERQKNHRLLMEAWKDIENKFPDEKLIIYGDGPLRTEYEKYINEYHLEKRILLPGRIKNVEERLASAKLFVLSSDFEGMPNALMEAMAVGVPCISTDCPCGGPRTLIRNQKEGILIPPNDVTALENAIQDMLVSSERENIGISAKIRSEIFNEKTIYEQWENFLLKN